jgi:hypothetical protein
MTCTKCTLQVIEFMSNHGLNNPGGCFYHHCADISIQPAGGGGASGGDAGAGADTGGGGNVTKASGCSYAGTNRGSLPGALLAACALALPIVVMRRRRRRAAR